MIPVTRDSLSATVQAKLATRSVNCISTATARAQWKAAKTEKKALRVSLDRMASSLLRCMYCGDNLGTDIDHFEPIAVSPYRAFDWMNHLLACSYCNSNKKRDRWPLDASGRPLLVDPTVVDPWLHLRLGASGEYRHITPQGEMSIDVFGLNRWELVRGRQAAWHTLPGLLKTYSSEVSAGNSRGALFQQMVVCSQPFTGVLYAFLRYLQNPATASIVPLEARTSITSQMMTWIR